MPESPTREVFLHLATWQQVVFYIVGGLASAIFIYGFWLRLRKYKKGRPDHRFDRLGRRIVRAAGTILSNSTVRKGEGFGGIAHTLILWGFIVLFIGTCIVALDHDFLRFFGLKLLQGNFYLGFSLVLDVFGVLFVIGLIMMIVRRVALKPAALDYTRADHQDGKVNRSGYVTDDMIFVWLLLAIAITGYAVEGLRIGQTMPEFERWSPVGWGLAQVLTSSLGRESGEAMFEAHLWSWWLHGLFALAFVAYVPFSKMMHIVTDAANLVFTDEKAGRRLPPALAGGVASVTDFTWKELLDFDACTKCGRCHVVCPATAAGTTLSPRDLILDLRTLSSEALGTPEFLKQRFLPGSKWPERTDGANVAEAVVRPETLWSCTTCMACMEACPVGIEHLTSIVQMRRHLVDRGNMDDNLQEALMSLGDYGNSFGQSPKKRARWTKGLSFKVKDARKEPVQMLWFVGDFASYDPRIQVLSRQVAEVFERAGLDFGILYDAERNAGNDVRRVGEEGLFEMLAEENASAMEGAEFEEIVTTDPHTLNTLRHEYPTLGDSPTVHHYTGVLAKLFADGTLKAARPLGYRVTYHDPCYLARYNGEINAPREVMRALGLDLQDMPRCGTNTFCCGAGGGRIWMDTSNEQQRTSEQRIEEALTLDGVRLFVTTCPKDYTMYSDAVKTLGVEDRIEVKDLIELVTEALD